MSCLFCKIIAGEIPSSRVYESETVLAFNDINPQAPVHIQIIPKTHIATVNDIPTGSSIASELFAAAQHISKEQAIDTSGYRLIMNCNENGGQEIFHIHLHLVGGRKLNWPPG